VLHALTAARGAMNSLIVEVLEDHVRLHILESGRAPVGTQDRRLRVLTSENLPGSGHRART